MQSANYTDSLPVPKRTSVNNGTAKGVDNWKKSTFFTRGFFLLPLVYLFSMQSLSAQTSVANRTVSDAQYCGTSSYYTVSITPMSGSSLSPYYKTSWGTFTEYSNGTASFQGLVYNANNSNVKWTINVTLTGRTYTTPSGSPKPHTCGSPGTSSWYYYTGFTGTLTGSGSLAGSKLNITSTGPAFQVGTGANIIDLLFGGHGRYNYTVASCNSFYSCNYNTTHGYFNIRLSGSALPSSCSNLTMGGSIGSDETTCGSSCFNPALITSLSLPSGGGNGTIEYAWHKTTDPNTAAGNASNYTVISGAYGSTYDPPSISQTTWYRRVARRQCCTSYAVQSNWVKKEISSCQPTCNNVTSGGTIGSNETVCGASFDPANITNTTSPSGGSGTLEYMWIKTTDPNTAAGTASNWTNISGANASSYNPSSISVTTWYRRLSRRSGCTLWDGESNWVKKEITGCQNITNGGCIGSDESVCNTCFDPALIHSVALPTGGCASSAIEYVWLKTTDPGTPAGTSWNVTVISGANGATYDPGLVTQTTWYRRCARRAGCSNYDGESNWVKKELLNNCCPTVTNPTPPSATVVSGQTVPSLCVNTNAPAGTSVKFLYFNSIQTSPYSSTGGTLIGNVTPSGGTACVSNVSFPINSTSSNKTYYVYAILNPIPTNSNCRPYQQFVITVTPGCSNVNSGGTIGYNQSNCGPFDPTTIQSLTLPTGGSGTLQYQWVQADPQDTLNNSAWGQITGATATTYNPPMIYESTCYLRTAKRSGCTSCIGESNWVCMTVKTVPDAPTVSGATTCENCPVTLTASGCSGGTLKWYTVATGGTSIATGASFTTPALNTNTTYYVECQATGCAGPRTPATVVVIPTPAAPSVTGGSVCGTGTVLLSASGCSGGTIKWFATNTSTNVINTGTTFTTPVLSTTTTYYVECHQSGCKGPRVPVVATVNPVLSAPVVSVTQPTCNLNTGTITVTNPTGAAFEYSFDNGATYQASNVKSGLAQGTYLVVVRKISTGCVSSACTPATINPPLNTPAAPALTLVQPDCNVGTGSITITAPIASNYEYSFNNGATFQSSPFISGLVPGTYQVKVKDISTGCISPATSAVLNNVTPIPTPVVTVTQPNCSTATGSVTVTSPTGAGMVFSFDNGVTYQASPTKSGLVAGGYYVIAKYTSTNCASPATFVTIDVSPIPAVSASSSPVCVGETIVLNATASVASPHTILGYSWTGVSGFSSTIEDPTILNATLAMSGNYTVEVTTSAGCTATASTNLTVNALPAAPTVSISQPNCSTGTGSITVVTPSSGVQYSFDNGTTFQPSATKSGLGAGSYNIVVKNNATGCVSLPAVAVINPQPGTPSVTASSNSPICAGSTINLSVSASIASGTITGYSWTGPNGFTSTLQNPSIPNATVSASGLYTVSVTTNAGCTGSDVANVVVNSLPNSGISGASSICALEGTLFQVVNPQPGDVYTWSFGPFASPSSSNASSETVTYAVGAIGTTQTATLVVTNANGCSSTYTHNINVTQSVFADAGNDKTICQGANATIGGSPAGPAGATYFWTPNLFLNDNTLANPTATPPSTITYTLTVTLNGCTRTDQVTASVNVNNNPIADAGPDMSICEGGSTTIGGSPTSSQPNSTYDWSPATGLSAVNIPNPIANPAITTVYQVIVTNQFGCKDTEMVVVTVNPLPATPSITATQPSCTVATGTITVDSPTGVSYEYSFDNGTSWQSSNTKSGLAAGIYQVLVRNVNTLCVSLAPVSAVINVQPTNCLTIGNIVFEDSNNNGTLDGTESGVANVAVSLYEDANNDGTPDGAAVATTNTNVNGEYLFSGLQPGTYIVGILAPNGYLSSSGTVASATGPYESAPDPDNDVNNDDNGTNQSGNVILSGSITLSIGGEPVNDGDLDANTNLSVDFGIFQALSLGNLVWEDVNNDGLFNGAESGINNIATYLYADNNLDNIPDGPSIATTTTNASGNYSFVYLIPGNYIVGINGGGYMSSSGLNASETGPYEPAPDPDNDVNDDDNGNNQGVNPILLSLSVTLSVGGESIIDGDTDPNSNLTLDFGLFHPAKIGNFVWNDLNRDGIQDIGELGVPNVQVNLYDNNNNLIATTSTDSSGYYLFSNIIAGTYVVQFAPSSLPSGYVISPQDATNDALDSDPNPTTGFTAPITLAYGQVNNDIDAGLNCPLPNATISSNSPICIGETIQLNATGGGTYLWAGPNGFFSNLANPAITNATLANSGQYDLTVTNAVCGASVHLAATVTVNSGPASGINGPTSICALEDALFQATNPQPGNTYSWTFGSLATPTSSTGSSQIVQYAVGAVGTSQTILLTVTTGANCSETYSWAVNVTPAVIASGGPDKTICQGASTQIGGAPTGPSGATYLWTPNLFLNSNSVANPMATPPATITYTVTVTLNGCVKTDQVTVNVDVNLNPIADAGQDQSICQGAATGVQIGGNPTSNQPGFIAWTPATGLSNAFSANPIATPSATTIYQVIVTNNFACPDTDYVVVAVNPLPSSPQASVVHPTCQVATGTITVTYPIGNYQYSFDNGITFQVSPTSLSLPSGIYQVKVKDDSTGCVSNATAITINAQPTNCLSIGDFVWEDVNNDGLFNGSEAGKPNITIYLYEDTNNDGTPDGGAIATTSTDANGNYLFSGLVPSTYLVGIVTPTGYISSSGTNASATGPYESAPDPDNDINNDDNGTAYSGNIILSKPVTLSIAGEPTNDGDLDANTNLTVDFGIYQPASIGNFVWNDLDRDGIQDSGEVGIPNIQVQLLDGSGNPILVASNPVIVSTDASGIYTFNNLAPGNYSVQFLPISYPAGFGLSPQDATTDNLDSDANPSSGISSVVSVVPGQAYVDLDAGLNCILPDVDAGNDTTITCTNAIVVLTGSSTTPGVTYSWTGPNGYMGGNPSTSVTLPGTYVLTVTSIGGCSNTDTVIVMINQTAPIADAGPDQTLTCSVTSVTIGTAAIAGNSYSWNTGATTAQISVSTPGTYTVTVTDNVNGCTATDNVVVNQNITPPTVNAGPDQTICNGGSIQLNGISNGVTFSWTPATGLSATNILNPTANPTVTTAYTLTVIGTNGCTNSDAATVTVNPTPDITATIPQQTYCLGNVFSLSLISVTDANSTSGAITFHTSTPPTAGNQVTGSIILNDTITIYVLSVTTNNCSDITSVTINPEPCKALLGDRVWNDTDKDGIQDPTEVGVSGVTVTLYKDNGSGTYLPVAGTLTDAFGNYLFAISQPGSYKVGFTLPTDYVFSPKDATTDANDSDPNTLTGLTDAITINYGDDIRTVDAGIYYTTPNNGSIGDYVWFDQNGNGIQEGTEPGFANITVTLYNGANQPIATTVTNADGYYQFTNLPAGNYTVGVSLPAGYNFSPVDATADNLDSDINPVTGKTATITLAAGEVKTTVDAGIKPANTGTASVGDYLWNDLNQNGIQDAGEPGVGGVTVQLFNFSNALVSATVTNEFGYYMFTNVAPGTYYVKFLIPAGYSVSPQDVGDDMTDSDIFSVSKQTNFFGLVSGQVLTTIDAGIYLTTPPGTASAGDYVWYDLNENGIQDANETGVPGVTVTLYDASTNAVVKTTATDDDGFYRFTGLAAGSYYIGFSNLPLDYQFTIQTTGTTNGSDANTSSGLTPAFTLAGGQYNADQDAGIIRGAVGGGKASLGDFVWNDLNNNGIQDVGEPGFPNVTVTLYQADGVTVIKTTTTDGQGGYIFNDLSAGQYVVGFGLPTGYNFVSANATSDDKDSDANTGTGKTGVIALAIGETNLTVDAGIFNPAATGIIGNFVWNDVNGNGVQDAGEPGIPGVTVTLYDATNDTPVGVAVTDDNGVYQIVGVPNGTYYVVFSNQPDGFTFSPSGNGTPTTDSDPNSDGKTPTFTFTGGVKNDVDAGLQSVRAAIGNYVWFDEDRDGVQDISEEGVPGVTVTLYDNTNTAIANAITDANGFYYFMNINPGTYTLGFSTLPLNVVFTGKDSPLATDATDSDVNPASGRTDAFTVNAGDVNYSFDAGIYTRIVSSLEGVAWLDVDRDGQRDPGELPVGGITVILYDSGVPVATTVTSGDGTYVFNDVTPGNNYTVGFSTLPPNTTISPQNQGSDLTDSDANPSTGITNPIVVPEGVSVKNNDLGIMPPAGAIGNYVWIDTDGNGIQNEAASSGLNGVPVQLWNPGGDLFSGTSDDILITSTVTANDGGGNPGYYLFDGLYFGHYYVRFPVVNSIGGLTQVDQGANDAIDSDPNRFTGNTGVVMISPDSVGIKRFNLTLDAGYTPSSPLCPGVCFVQDTVVYADTLVRQLFDIENGVLTLPQFDPSLGTLSYAEIEAEVRVNLDYSLENLGATPRIVKIQTDGSIVVTGPGITPNLTNIYNVLQTIDTLAKTDGVFGSGPDFTSADSVPVRQTYKEQVLSSLAPFIGTGALNYDVDGIANSNVIGSGTLSSLILTYGEVVLRVRYVYCRTVCAKVGDYVWDDDNQDGIQDPAETGVSGVTVTLYNNVNQPVATTSTDAQGAYTFNNVFPGNYSVGVTLPATYAFTLADQGGDDDTDSDINPATGRSMAFAVNALSDVDNVDAGIYVSQSPRSTIGNRVWNDANGNGLQENAETGLANITVELFDNNGNLTRCTSTDANGNYAFTDVNAGTYSMRVACPVGYVHTLSNVGSDDDLDNDVDATTGLSQPLTVTVGQTVQNLDAGIKLQATNKGAIGDLVWNDLNKDGIYASSEPGLSGVNVSLLDINSSVLSQTTTDVFGKYIFNNLAAGSYKVKVDLPTGFVMSPKTTTTNANTNNDFNPTGISDVVILANGNKRITVDAAMNNSNPAGTAKLGNLVWNDLDQNGVRASGEAGVAGVMVDLIDATNDAVLQTTMTKSNGTYQFVELAAGSYKVRFYNIPVSKQFTVMGVGAASQNSDANPATGITDVINLAAGQTNNNIDAGLIPSTGRASTTTVGDFVWNDLNNNGIQEYGEPGMGNVQVNLISTDGIITKQTTTDANGHYIFNDLQQGNYILTFSNLPAGYNFVATNQTDENRDSDVNSATGQTDEIALNNGQSALNVDAGVYNSTATATVGNIVWNDKDRNGVQDGGEVGVPGITVTLFNTANQPVQSTISNVDGRYLLVGIAEGAYRVQFSNIPEGFFFTGKNMGNAILDSDADPVSGMTEVFYLVAGQGKTDMDAGIYTDRAAIGNYVWADANNNGLQEVNETGFAGITVKLLNSVNEAVSTAVSDADGHYQFVNILPGQYKVSFSNLPEGTRFSNPNANNNLNDLEDSDVDYETGLTPFFTVALGDVAYNWDAGIYVQPRGAMIGNVWVDENNDGLQTDGEAVAAGVSVNLYDAQQQLVTSSITNEEGIYLFSELVAGVYEVIFDNLPEGATYTTSNVNANANDSTDSDILDLNTGSAGSITIVAGETKDGPDAGLRTPAGISGIAFSDDNSNGVRDANETGIANVIVSLYSTTGQVVATTETDGNGNYTISTIEVGTVYQLGFAELPLRDFTAMNAGNDDAIDSDVADKTQGNAQRGRTLMLTPFAIGELRTNYDAGYLQAGQSLPDETIVLNAELVNNDGVLDWVTSVEWNSNYFEVQRSLDGANFTEIINTKDASGYSMTPTEYTDTDAAVGSLGVSKVYYRIKLNDADGTYRYSNIVELPLNQDASNVYMNVYPIPASSDIYVDYQLLGATVASLRIVNPLGQVLYEEALDPGVPSKQLHYDVREWSKGVYYFEIYTETNKITQKVVVQ